MHHYPEHELEKFRAGNMNIFHRLLCKIHLWHCSECAEKLNTLDEDELILTDLRSSMTDADDAPNNNTYNSLCDHFNAVKGSTI